MLLEIEKDLNKALELRRQLSEWEKDRQVKYSLDNQIEEVTKLLLGSVARRLAESEAAAIERNRELPF